MPLPSKSITATLVPAGWLWESFRKTAQIKKNDSTQKPTDFIRCSFENDEIGMMDGTILDASSGSWAWNSSGKEKKDLREKLSAATCLLMKYTYQKLCILINNFIFLPLIQQKPLFLSAMDKSPGSDEC